VFRIAVLSIVLSLAIGPEMWLACRAWCDPIAAATACHDEEPANAAKVTPDDSCETVLLSAAAALREEVRRGTASDASHAIDVPRYQPAHLTNDSRPELEPQSEWSLEHRPLSTILRI